MILFLIQSVVFIAVVLVFARREDVANRERRDLLNRLMSRSYEQYAAIPEPDAFLEANKPGPPKRKLYDPTGLLEVDIDDDE